MLCVCVFVWCLRRPSEILHSNQHQQTSPTVITSTVRSHYHCVDMFVIRENPCHHVKWSSQSPPWSQTPTVKAGNYTIASQLASCKSSHLWAERSPRYCHLHHADYRLSSFCHEGHKEALPPRLCTQWKYIKMDWDREEKGLKKVFSTLYLVTI